MIKTDGDRVTLLEDFYRSIDWQSIEVADHDWTPPPESKTEKVPNTNLEWRAEPYPEEWRKETQTLNFARGDLASALDSYVFSDIYSGRGFLALGPAGLGKTHTAVHLAQKAADNGYKVLWCSQRHDSFFDLAGIEGFKPKSWYNWLPIHSTADPNDPIGTTCIHAENQFAWAERGYPTMAFCSQMCQVNGWIKKCKFRKQSRRREPIIFARHQHLISGVSISGFDVVIIDEVPTKAFQRDRKIPTAGIIVPGASGPILRLMRKLAQIAGEMHGGRVSGKSLLDMIGPYLRDVFIDYKQVGEWVPAPPQLDTANDAQTAPYFYILEFLKLIYGEFESWKNDRETWITRVWVTREGLHLLSKYDPWNQLPGKVIALDATGSKAIYERLFGIPFLPPHKPELDRIGNLYQITGRQNGVGTIIDKPDRWDGDTLIEAGTLTDAGIESLEVAKQLAARYDNRVCVICSKKMRSHAEREFGSENVANFWGNRGSNKFESAEALIILGNPQPRASGVIQLATVLNPARVDPFTTNGSGDYIEFAMMPIPITEALYTAKGGRIPYRRTLRYIDPELQLIHEQLCAAELYQSLHRLRPNVSEGDIWIMTSTPTDELADQVYDNPPIGPDKIPWRKWIQLSLFLDETEDPIGYDEIADAAGVTKKHARDQRWLNAIYDHEPDRWDIEKIKLKKGPGRPSDALVKHK